MKYHAGYKTAISLSGKATVIISKTIKTNGAGNAPRLFCTTEDLFTQSFVLPYVIPMLENAGAVVYTPRERDTQKNEIIVDNDTPNASLYLEVGSKKLNGTEPR